MSASHFTGKSKISWGLLAGCHAAMHSSDGAKFTVAATIYVCLLLCECKSVVVSGQSFRSYGGVGMFMLCCSHPWTAGALVCATPCLMEDVSVQSHSSSQVSPLSTQAATAMASRCRSPAVPLPHRVIFGVHSDGLLALVESHNTVLTLLNLMQEADEAGPRCVHLISPKLSLKALQAVLVYLYTERLEADMEDMEVSRITMQLYSLDRTGLIGTCHLAATGLTAALWGAGCAACGEEVQIKRFAVGHPNRAPHLPAEFQDCTARESPSQVGGLHHRVSIIQVFPAELCPKALYKIRSVIIELGVMQM